MNRRNAESLVERWMDEKNLQFRDLLFIDVDRIQDVDDDTLETMVEDAEEDRSRDLNKGILPNY